MDKYRWRILTQDAECTSLLVELLLQQLALSPQYAAGSMVPAEIDAVHAAVWRDSADDKKRELTAEELQQLAAAANEYAALSPAATTGVPAAPLVAAAADEAAAAAEADTAADRAPTVEAGPAEVRAPTAMPAVPTALAVAASMLKGLVRYIKCERSDLKPVLTKPDAMQAILQALFSCAAAASCDVCLALHSLLFDSWWRPGTCCKEVLGALQQCLGQLATYMQQGHTTALLLVEHIAAQAEGRLQLLAHVPALLAAVKLVDRPYAAAAAASLLCNLTVPVDASTSAGEAGRVLYDGARGREALASQDIGPLIHGLTDWGLGGGHYAYNCAAAVSNIAITAAGRVALQPYVGSLLANAGAILAADTGTTPSSSGCLASKAVNLVLLAVQRVAVDGGGGATAVLPVINQVVDGLHSSNYDMVSGCLNILQSMTAEGSSVRSEGLQAVAAIKEHVDRLISHMQPAPPVDKASCKVRILFKWWKALWLAAGSVQGRVSDKDVWVHLRHTHVSHVNNLQSLIFWHLTRQCGVATTLSTSLHICITVTDSR